MASRRRSADRGGRQWWRLLCLEHPQAALPRNCCSCRCRPPQSFPWDPRRVRKTLPTGAGDRKKSFSLVHAMNGSDFRRTGSKVSRESFAPSETTFFFRQLSVPKNRNRRKIASVFKSQSSNRKFYCRNRRKIARKSQKKSQKNRCDFWGCGIKIAAFPRFQNRSVFGTLSSPGHPRFALVQNTLRSLGPKDL